LDSERPAATIQDFSQGAIQAETGPLDAAIQGSGFFITQNANGNTLYTRDGTFQMDDKGNLTTATGEDVMGWTALNADAASTPVAPLAISRSLRAR